LILFTFGLDKFHFFRDRDDAVQSYAFTRDVLHRAFSKFFSAPFALSAVNCFSNSFDTNLQPPTTAGGSDSTFANFT